MCLAVPGEIVAVYEREGVRFGDVRFGGVSREVCLHAVPSAVRGDFVLVHVGFAIATIDREAAERALDLHGELLDAEARRR
jgi:hydrogenase expression/formation protein HypC